MKLMNIQFGKPEIMFANVLLYSYLLDGLISVSDVLMQSWLSLPLLSGPRLVVANLVIYLSMFWIPLIIFSPRLPKFPLLWLSISAFWFSYGAMPLPFLLPQDSINLSFMLCLVQISIGLITLARLYQTNGSYCLAYSQVTAGTWSLSGWFRRWVPISILLMVMSILYLPLSALMISKALTLFPYAALDGIYIREGHYQNAEGKSVRLVGMVHVGERETYHAIFDSFVGPSTVVLEELVGGDQQTQGHIDNIYGLQTSKEVILQPIASRYLKDKDVTVRNADVKQTSLAPETLSWIRSLGENPPLRIPFILSQLFDSETEEARKLYEQLEFDIVTRRDISLIAHLTVALAEFDTVIVPWGAAHMPEVERHLYSENFRLEKTTNHRILSWSSITAEKHNPRVEQHYSDDELLSVIATAQIKLLASKQAGIELISGPANKTDESKQTYFGGLPKRLGNESWPHNPQTGKPMAFIAQISRNEINADFMGRISKVRVFVDYEKFTGLNEHGTYAIWASTTDETLAPETQWPTSVIDSLKSHFATSDYYYNQAPFLQYPIVQQPAIFVDDSLRPDSPSDLSRDQFQHWRTLADEAEKSFKAKHPRIKSAFDSGILGGHPYWVQYPEPQDIPLLLQLYPPREMQWGDAGHFYLFMDKSNPKNGAILIAQSS
ncbi:MAG: hypothetical protein ACJAX5_002206 [Patiriisocius sp.]|jgi:hypothetical protein